MNTIVLMGRLAAAPEKKQPKENLTITNYTLAVERPYAKGEDKTDFINCTAFGKSAEFVSKYFQKGQKVSVVGRLQIDKWTDEAGNKKTAARVITEKHYFAESKRTNENKKGEEDTGFYPIEEGEEDDDLPF